MSATYTHLHDFVNHFIHESKSTAKLLESINEAHADAEPTPGVRSLRRLSWHLAKSQGEFGAQMGLPVTVFSNDDKPDTVAGMANLYKHSVDEFIKVAQENLSDENMNDQFSAWGMPMTKGAMLYLLLSHDVHHRGQMQVIVRMVGDIPVGVLGPTAEEEATYMQMQQQQQQ